MVSEIPNFCLHGVFDSEENRDFTGPLSLILMLLQKNKIEIRDIRVSDILDQYLAYIESMQAMDLEIASEFVQMASYLLYIKTRMMLAEEKEEISELEELMASLEKLKCRDVLQSIRAVVPELKSLSEQGSRRFVKQPEAIRLRTRPEDYDIDFSQLLSALLHIHSKGKNQQAYRQLESSMPRRIVFSVRTKSVQLLDRLRNSPCRLRELYESCTSRSELIATFLSVLELCSMGNIRVSVENEEMVLQFSGGNVDEIIEKIEE